MRRHLFEAGFELIQNLRDASLRYIDDDCACGLFFANFIAALQEENGGDPRDANIRSVFLADHRVVTKTPST